MAYRIVVIGDTGVGKSTFLKHLSLLAQPGDRDTEPTIGVDMVALKLADAATGRVIRYHFWDTAGQERFRSITRQFYHNLDAIVVMYDVSRRSDERGGADSVHWWLADVATHGDDLCGERVPTFVVANKVDVDMEDSTQRRRHRESLTGSLSLTTLYYELCARDATQSKRVGENIARLVHETRAASRATTTTTTTLPRPCSSFSPPPFRLNIRMPPPVESSSSCCGLSSPHASSPRFQSSSFVTALISSPSSYGFFSSASASRDDLDA